MLLKGIQSHYELDQTDIPSSFLINYGPTFVIGQDIKCKLNICMRYGLIINCYIYPIALVLYTL